MNTKKRIKVIIFSFILILVLGCSPTKDDAQNAIKSTEDLEEGNKAEKMIGKSSLINDCGSPKPREFTYEKFYTGPLIDTHLHLPVASKIISDTSMGMGFEDMPHRGDIPIEKIACQLKNDGITKAFGFLIQHTALLDSSVKAVKEDVSKYPDLLVPFFMPPFPIEGQAPDPTAVEEVLKNNPGLFKGYGEARFDFQNIQNALPEDPYFQEIYALSDKYDLIVQIHPKKGQVAAMENLLQKYPNVLFLAHLMKDDRAEIPRLLKKYPNMYYSLDAEISYIFGYQTIQNNKGPTKEEYLASLRKNFDAQLKETLGFWKPIIEAHPNQLTWGSDRWFTWHFDPEVGALIVEFSRTFIGHLDPTVQEKFAYKNAEGMLEKR